MNSTSTSAAAVTAPLLDIRAVSHSFGGQRVLDDVSLAVQPNEIVVLLGPSGCGKSTLLRSVAGFVRPSHGEIRIAGRSVGALPPGQRNIGIVFQNYALFPHLTVFDNVAYGLRARGVARADIAPRTRAALETVRMTTFDARMPRELSGGQQQRVALARALVTEPSMILLDEPFAALDKNLRIEMQAELKRLQRERGLTAVLVTHDQEEAMNVGDRIAVMRQGQVEQIDRPAQIYDRPASLFVNEFVGAANLLRGTVVDGSARHCRVRLDAGATLTVAASQTFAAGRQVIVSVRPEHLMFFAAPADDRWPVRLRASTVVGGTLREELLTNDGIELTRMSVRASRDAEARTGLLLCGLRHGDDANLFPID